MPYVFNTSGKFLTVDGKMAMSQDCCCGCCIGCEGDTGNIPDLLFSVNAAASTENPNGPLDCGDEGCQDLTGDYTAGNLTDCDLETSFETFCIDDSPTSGLVHCVWQFDDTEATMCTGGLGFQYFRHWRFIVEQADDGNYYAQAILILNTTSSFTLGYFWVWSKNLGATKPDCSTLFPLTFNNTDFICPDEDSEFYAQVCFYSDIEITVDLP